MYLFCAFVLLLFVYVFYTRARKYKDFNSLPGPPTLPVLGNLFDIGTNTVEVLTNLKKFNKQYGDIFRLWIGPLIPNVVVCDPKHMEAILSSTVHIHKSSTYEIFHSFLGQGLITSPGNEKWKKHRKMLTPAFHFKILERFIYTFESLADALLAKFEQHLDSDGFDMYPYINRYTLDVICETSMGLSFFGHDDLADQYLKNLFELENRFTMRQFSLIGRSEKWYQYLPEYQKWQECVEKVKAFTTNVMKQKYELWKTNKSNECEEKGGKEPLLDLLFSVWEKGDIDMEEIREELDTFMFAGHDTTSSSISFILFELAKHQDVQEKILHEIKTNIGDSNDAPITISNLSSLKYLESACKEAMRIYTTVPFVERGVYDHLELDGKVIPKGTTVTLFFFGLHHNPKCYTDPEKFDPCRFLSENNSNKNPYSFLPFSAGPRNCIGQRFAMLEVKATVAKIIRNLLLLPVEPAHECQLGTSAILKSLNGIPIRIKRR